MWIFALNKQCKDKDMALRSVLLLPLLLGCIASLSAQTEGLDLIPRPWKLKAYPGVLDLHHTLPLYLHEGFESIVPLVRSLPGVQISTTEIIKKSSRRQRRQGIRIIYANDSDQLPEGGHRILINENGILIKAHNPPDLIPATHTLHQLLLLQADSAPALPYVDIVDGPRFPYRGMHLDASSQFVPPAFVKKYIDLIGLYKFNYFHWQLANGGGWRLESHRYPSLVQQTSWRSHSDFGEWKQYGQQFVPKGHPNAYGGFYTKEDVRALVQFASERGITIVPEVDILSPSKEILVAFPEFSDDGKIDTAVIKNILDELMDLFPSPYIHIGDVEAPRSEGWPSDSIARFASDYVAAQGRQIMTWGEIAGRPRSVALKDRPTTVEAIDGSSSTVAAFPSRTADTNPIDPRIRSSLFDGYAPLKPTYSDHPLPSSNPKEKAKHLLGIQGNLWTASRPFPQQLEQIAFPRALALSEMGWTMEEHRNYEDFSRRLQQHYRILQERHIHYTPPSFAISYEIDFDPQKFTNKVKLVSEQHEPTIRYTTDGNDPSRTSTLYHLPVELTGTTTLKAANFIDSVRVGPIETVQLDIHKAIGKRTKYNRSWTEDYPGRGDKTLTNGEKGRIDRLDEEWQGFVQSLDVVIDLGRREEINQVSANFIQIPSANILFPDEFRISVSENGKTYREIGLKKNDEGGEAPLKPKTFTVKAEKPLMARYVKVVANGKSGSSLLTDEVVIY